MSVGQPLYTGHLIMLAGFTAYGDPIVHDPAQSNGYSYVFNKTDLSHSWFDKGGVGYTFYPAGSEVASVEPSVNADNFANEFQLYQNYPNPFNPSTRIGFRVRGSGLNFVRLAVYDVLGREMAVLVNGRMAPGTYGVTFDASHLTSGVYFCRMISGNFAATTRMVLAR